MIKSQDVIWAKRWQGRALAIAAIRRWLDGQSDDAELEEAVGAFVNAVATRVGLPSNPTRIVKAYILRNYLPELRRNKEQVSDDDLWHNMAWMVLYLVDCRKDEKAEHPYDEIEGDDRTMARIVKDVDSVIDVVAAGEKELVGESEDEVLRIKQEEILRHTSELDKVLVEWNRRELEARVPVYMLIRTHPGRYRALVSLWAALGSIAFEEFVAAFAGQNIKMPSARDYKAFERTRRMFQLRSQGETQKAIGKRFGISQSAVAQRLDRLDKAHHTSWLTLERGFLAALTHALKMLVLVTTRKRLQQAE